MSTVSCGHTAARPLTCTCSLMVQRHGSQSCLCSSLYGMHACHIPCCCCCCLRGCSHHNAAAQVLTRLAPGVIWTTAAASSARRLLLLLQQLLQSLQEP